MMGGSKRGVRGASSCKRGCQTKNESVKPKMRVSGQKEKWEFRKGCDAEKRLEAGGGWEAE